MILPPDITPYENESILYHIYILSSDIEEKDLEVFKALLHTDEKDANFKLTYIDMQHRYEDIFTAHHFTKEVLYKLDIPTLFPQYERVIITDIDAIFLDDLFYALDFSFPNYFAGVGAPDGVDGGFLVANLTALRSDNMQEKMLDFLKANDTKLSYAEQDVINIMCKPAFCLPRSFMKRNYIYDLVRPAVMLHYTRGDLQRDARFKATLQDGGHKPFAVPNMLMSDVFYEYLVKTPYLQSVLVKIEENVINSLGGRRLLTFMLRRVKRRLERMLFRTKKTDKFSN